MTPQPIAIENSDQDLPDVFVGDTLVPDGMGTSRQQGQEFAQERSNPSRNLRWYVIACKPKSPWAAYLKRLRAKGKTEKQVVVAMMHKLLRVIYGVFRSVDNFFTGH